MATDAEIMAVRAAMQSWREPTDTAELMELARRYRTPGLARVWGPK